MRSAGTAGPFDSVFDPILSLSLSLSILLAFDLTAYASRKLDYRYHTRAAIYLQQPCLPAT